MAQRTTKALRRARNLSNWLSQAFNIDSGACIGVSAVLVTYCTMSRYLFARATYIMEELTALLLVGVSFLAFSYTFVKGRHVRVTLLINRLPSQLRDRLEVVCSVITLVYLTIFIKLSYDFVRLSYQLDCHSVGARIYEVPWMAIMPAGMVVFAIVVLVSCIDKVKK